ncbi:Uncharacterised protein [Klebsiella pneumoniae]|nr:Uncharacterised protein [Klebsiella pneumoniae]
MHALVFRGDYRISPEYEFCIGYIHVTYSIVNLLSQSFKNFKNMGFEFFNILGS